MKPVISQAFLSRITEGTIANIVLTTVTGEKKKEHINHFACVFSATGTQDDDTTGGRIRKLSVGQYDNDVPGQPLYNRGGWMKSPAADQAVNPGSPVPAGGTKEVNNEEFFKKDLLKLIARMESHVRVQCPESM